MIEDYNKKTTDGGNPKLENNTKDIDYNSMSQEDLIEFAKQQAKIRNDFELHAKKLKEQNKELKEKVTNEEEPKEKPKENGPKETDTITKEDLLRLRLEARGVADKEAQDKAILYSKLNNIDVVDALNSAGFKAELNELMSKKKSEDASIGVSSSVSENTLTDTEFEKGMLNEDIEITPENIDKFTEVNWK